MSTPDAVPLLRPGTHLSPDDGACLMELVSILAGERWSDHPACTDPTLATIGRVVNDELGDDARQTLSVLAPGLVGCTGDPAQLAPTLVERCLAVTQQHLHRPVPTLRRHQRRAARRLRGHRNGSRRRLTDRALSLLYIRGPAQRAITAMVVALRRLPERERDNALRAVLHAAIAVTGPNRTDNNPAPPAPPAKSPLPAESNIRP